MLLNIDFIKTTLNAVSLKLNKALTLCANSLLKVEQNLTENEQEIARRNIGAASADNISVLTVHALSTTDVGHKIDLTFDEIQDAILSGRQVQLRVSTHMYPLVEFGRGYNITFGSCTETFTVSTSAPEVTYTINSTIRLYDRGANKTVILFVENGKIIVR